MPNWVNNRIIFSEDIPQEKFEAMLLGVLREEKGDGEISDVRLSVSEVKALSDEEKIAFDFNTLIPMPAELNIESSSVTNMGLLLYQARMNFPKLLEKRILEAVTFQDIFTEGTSYSCKQEFEAIAKFLKDELGASKETEKALEKLRQFVAVAIQLDANSYWGHSFLGEMNYFEGLDTAAVLHGLLNQMKIALQADRIKMGFPTKDLAPMDLLRYIETDGGSYMYKLGEKAYANTQKYGSKDWYDWRCANWGTKWNASETQIDWENREIFFQTAWSAPTPIIFALHTHFPDVGFTWYYADEDCGYNAGVISTLENGNVIGNEPEGGSSAAYEIYIKCWDESDCLYQDDNDKWHRYDCDDCPHPC